MTIPTPRERADAVMLQVSADAAHLSAYGKSELPETEIRWQLLGEEITAAIESDRRALLAEDEETVEALAKVICMSAGSNWQRICEDEPFPPFWDGSLITREEYRKDARAALAELRRLRGVS